MYCVSATGFERFKSMWAMQVGPSLACESRNLGGMDLNGPAG